MDQKSNRSKQNSPLKIMDQKSPSKCEQKIRITRTKIFEFPNYKFAQQNSGQIKIIWICEKYALSLWKKVRKSDKASV
tara:strand:+ start:383 stop:616 length:234 start_codon:yes stop_codon:yes gene_type:complete